MSKMITVKVGSNMNREDVLVPSSKTLREVLDENRVNYTRAQVHLDGAPLRPGDMDKTFDAIGITESCYLIAVLKTDNA